MAEANRNFDVSNWDSRIHILAINDVLTNATVNMSDIYCDVTNVKPR